MAYEKPAIESLGDAQMSEVMGAFSAFGTGFFIPGLSLTFPFGTGGPVVFIII